jgi:RsiW-degrading membrane proteinase PrsW (M82 family)
VGPKVAIPRKPDEMDVLKAFAIISLAFALSSCVVPVVDKVEATPSSCQTTTRSMSLRMADQNVFIHGTCHDQACLTAALAVFAGSAVISGSIVLTNNTVHWLEYQGTCSDSYLNIAKQRFLDSLDKPRQPPAS